MQYSGGSFPLIPSQNPQYKIVGIKKELHKHFPTLFNIKHRIRPDTLTVVIIPEYKPYNTWDYIAGFLSWTSEGGYTFVTNFTTGAFQKALLRNSSTWLKGFFGNLSLPCAILDSTFSCAMMLNMPVEREGANEGIANVKKDWGTGKLYRAVTVFNFIFLLGAYSFGSLMPSAGLAEYSLIQESSEGYIWVSTLGIFFWFGQMSNYIYTNTQGITATPNILFGKNVIKTPDEKRISVKEAFSRLSCKQKFIFSLMTIASVTNRSWGFYGGFNWFRNSVLDGYFPGHNPAWLGYLSYVSAGMAGFLTLFSQGVTALKILIKSPNLSPEFHFRNKGIELIFKSLFWTGMGGVLYARVMSVPDRAFSGLKPEDFTTKEFLLAIPILIFALLSGIQYVFWVYPAALSGFHYLLNQIDCHRGTLFSTLGGEDNTQYITLTAEELKQLEQEAKKHSGDVPELKIENKDVAPQQARNQGGLVGLLQNWLCCCLRKSPLTAAQSSLNTSLLHEESISSQSDESLQNQNSGVWNAITTCCGLLNYLRNGKELIQSSERHEMKLSSEITVDTETSPTHANGLSSFASDDSRFNESRFKSFGAGNSSWLSNVCCRLFGSNPTYQAIQSSDNQSRCCC